MTKQTKEIDDCPKTRWAKHLAVFFILLSWAVAAMGWVPYNFIVEVVGVILWLYVSIKWKDWDYTLQNAFVLVMATISIFTNW